MEATVNLDEESISFTKQLPPDYTSMLATWGSDVIYNLALSSARVKLMHMVRGRLKSFTPHDKIKRIIRSWKPKLL